MSTKRLKYLERPGEKGAAMVMALLISVLLLAICAGLLLESSMNSQNVTDAIAEQQAFHAAESGIQSAVHVLRCQKNQTAGCGDVVANPLPNPSSSPTDEANQVDYLKAVTVATSNNPLDTSTTPRLSRWLNYSSTCGAASVSCVPLNQAGFAFGLNISDPDNTSNYVSFTMTGKLYANDGLNTAQMTYNRDATGAFSSSNQLKITYIPPDAVTNADLSSGTLTTSFGKFKLEKSGTGQVVTTKNRFEIVVTFTRPFAVTRVMRGWILPTTTASEIPKIIFDSRTLTVVGSSLTLSLGAAPSSGWSSIQVLLPPAVPAGYQAQPSIGENVIGGTISAFEPQRLLVKSTGYGPRGAKKELQAIIQKNFFNGLTAPAALTLVGPRSTANPASDFFFSAGSSAALTYSGFDAATGGTDIIPAIGTTDGTNLSCVEEYISNYTTSAPCIGTNSNGTDPFNGSITGSPSNVTIELPYWLQTPSQLDASVHQLAETAKASNRFFATGLTPDSWGDVTTGTGLTFCDGDVELGHNIGDGGGILVVTGTLTLQGSFTFNGLIIVTGAGGVRRSGGGDGVVMGNMVVAPYVNPRLVDDPAPADGITYDKPAGIFLAPVYNLDGGGTSTLQFNSKSLANSLTAISNFVLGVMEK